MYDLVPGAFVRLGGAPDWGIGQIQSAIGNRVTVNFENAGKQVIDIGTAELMVVDPDRPADPRQPR